MGAGLCRVADRPRRGTQPGDAAIKTVRVHDRGARPLRTGGPRRRGAGIGNLGGDPAVRALAGRALQAANHRTVAGGNPSARAAEDGRKRLARTAALAARLFRHRQTISELTPTGCQLASREALTNNLL